MENFSNFYYDISTYLNGLPILVGIYYWRKLSLALKIFLIGSFLGFIISVSSEFFSFSNGHFLYYALSTVVVIMYSFFFREIINFKYSNKLFLLIILAFITYLGFDYLLNGLKLYFVIPFLIIDSIFLPFSIYLFIQKKVNRAIRVLNIGILINFCSDIPITLFTNFFFKYFQGKAFQMIFFGLSPIFNLTYSIFQIYAFYLAGKQSTPEFDNMSDFIN